VGGTCSIHGVIINSYKALFRKFEGKKPLGKPIHGWEDNINMDLKEIWCEGVEQMQLAVDRI
jgi:hypothetical protein